MFTLENNMNRLLETNAKADVPNEPDAQIIFHDTPYISYPQITLDDNFLAYFNGILRSCGALRTGVISSPYQQSQTRNTLVFIQEKTYYYLIVLGLQDLNNLL